MEEYLMNASFKRVLVMSVFLTGLAMGPAVFAQGGTWTTKAPMPTPRVRVGTAVVNGVIYAVGGNAIGVLSTVEAYDPATNSWISKAPMPTARGEFGISVVNNVIYVIGGTTGSNYIGTVEAYDPATNTWTTKAPMPTPRYGVSASA